MAVRAMHRGIGVVTGRVETSGPGLDQPGWEVTFCQPEAPGGGTGMPIERAAVQAALPLYELLEEVGRGAHGSVFLARHRGLDQLRAVKTVETPVMDEDGTSRRFLLEAQTMGELDHPHIVRIAEYIEHGALRLLVMEYMAGGTLTDRLDGPVAPEVACAWALAAADALEAAHLRGVVHRDIKPDNLLFTAEGRLKVSDFGIAKPLSGAAATTSPGLLGTLLYMAPEQLTEGPVTAAADVYALGATLYQLLAGRTAYPHYIGTLPLLNLRLSEEPAPLAGVPPRVAAVVADAMRREPTQRPATARQFGLALARAAAGDLSPAWLRDSGVPLRIAPDFLDAAATAGSELAPVTAAGTNPTNPNAVDARTAPAASGWRRRWALPIGVLAAIALVTGGALVLRPSDGPDRGSASHDSGASVPASPGGTTQGSSTSASTAASVSATPWALEDPYPPYWLPVSKQAPSTPLDGIAITSPAAGAHVPATCITVTGTSRLPAGKTLLLALRNTSGANSAPYFYYRVTSDRPPSLATWHGSGSTGHAVYQLWQIAVLLADQKRLEDAWNKYAPNRSAMDSTHVKIPGLQLAALQTFNVSGGTVVC